MLGPLTYNDGMKTYLVGVTSYGVGTCGALWNAEGFAKVSYALDWIRDNSDNYVKTCSGKLGKTKMFYKVYRNCYCQGMVCFQDPIIATSMPTVAQMKCVPKISANARQAILKMAMMSAQVHLYQIYISINIMSSMTYTFQMIAP